MSLLNIRQWPSTFQRLVGLGPLLNVVAVHSKITCFPAHLIESWYNEAIEWIEGFGYSARTLSFVGVEGFEDGDSYDFEKADKKLRKRGFANVPHITINAAPFSKVLIPGLTDQWELYLSVSLSNMLQQPSINRLVWAWERDKRPLSREVFLKTVEFAERWNFLDYAFAFQDYSRNLPANEAKQPSFHEKLVIKRGIISGKGYPTKKVYESGKHPIEFLRDVYLYQILSPIHLSYRMGDQSLREWIEASATHGTLEKFAGQRWLWSIPDDRLKEVRQSLASYNLLTLYLPDMSRILEDYGRPQG